MLELKFGDDPLGNCHILLSEVICTYSVLKYVHVVTGRLPPPPLPQPPPTNSSLG